MSWLAQLWDHQNFDGKLFQDFTRAHAEVPVFACALYLVFVFQVPQVLKEPIPLRKLNAIWDFILAVFSVFGAFFTVPVLVRNLMENGFVWTVCENPHNWFGSGPCGLWVALFIYSKIPELLDTVFLVLQKKKVIFLHWFHHLTVLLYCWHAYHNNVAPGLWFASMNFTVHSIMYTYYLCMAIGLRRLVKPIAPAITSLQIIQMVGGVIVTVTSAVYHFNDPTSCHVDSANLKLGLAMYASYLILFAMLFNSLYLKPTAEAVKTGCPDIAASLNVSDGSGFFHGSKDSKPSEHSHHAKGAEKKTD